MTLKERVQSILKYSRAARNSDVELQIIYLQKSGMNLTPEQMEVFRSLNMESIRRERQTIQAAGMYTADQKIKKTRMAKAEIMRHAPPNERAEILNAVKEIGW